MWANQPKLDDIDSDTEICLDKEAIEITIAKLEDVADSFKPLKRVLILLMIIVVSKSIMVLQVRESLTE